MANGGKPHLLGLALMLAALGAWPVAARATADLQLVLQSDPNVHDWNETATRSADGRFVVAVGSATGRSPCGMSPAAISSIASSCR